MRCDIADKRRAPGSEDAAEISLLFRCAHYSVHRNEERLLGLDLGNIDGEILIRLCHYHGMLPLVFHCLPIISRSGLSKSLQADIGREFAKIALTNTMMTSELIAVLDLFRSENIAAVPWKGPCLAAMLYGSFLLREFGDIDILVPRRQVREAAALLLSRGYYFRGEFRNMPENYEFRLESHDHRIAIGLHWKIAHNLGPRLEYEDICHRLTVVPLGGRNVSLPPLEDIVLPLCLHEAKHLWTRLLSVCDLAKLMEISPSLEPTWLYAQKIGMKRMLSLGMWLARELLDARIPESLGRLIENDPVVVNLGLKFARELKAKIPANDISNEHRWAGYLNLQERLSDRFNTYKGIVHTCRWWTARCVDEAFLGLPPRLTFLYYAYYPLRFAGKYVLTPMRRLARGIFKLVAGTDEGEHRIQSRE
jgi:hypothetical protein